MTKIKNTAPRDLSKFALVNLDVHSWTGRKKMEDGDIEGRVPPKKLASLGTKAIIDPAKIKVFDTLKRKAERRIKSVAIKVMGAWAVPLNLLEDLKKDLELIRDEFYKAKSDFLVGYHEDVEQWIADAKKDPEGDWSRILIEAVTPEHYLQKQIQFAWQSFKVSATAADQEGMDNEINSMSEKLFEDIKDETLSLYQKSFFMKTSVLQKAIPPVAAIQKKLHGLSFLDPRAFAISELMFDVLNNCPREGRVEGENLSRIQSVLYMLSDVERMKEFGQDAIDGSIDLDSILNRKQSKTEPPKTKPALPSLNQPKPSLMATATKKADEEAEKQEWF